VKESSKGRLLESEKRLSDFLENNLDNLNIQKCRNNSLQFIPSNPEHENQNPTCVGI